MYWESWIYFTNAGLWPIKLVLQKLLFSKYSRVIVWLRRSTAPRGAIDNFSLWGNKFLGSWQNLFDFQDIWISHLCDIFSLRENWYLAHVSNFPSGHSINQSTQNCFGRTGKVQSHCNSQWTFFLFLKEYKFVWRYSIFILCRL